jgi:diguanylate cyclase (GGDEF)-like protein/PAS domain S-box-containing protein
MAALNGFAIVSALVGLREVKERDIRRAESRSQDLSLAAGQSAANIIDKIDISLRTVVYEAEKALGEPPSRGRPIDDAISEQFELIVESENLSVTDAEGTIVYHQGQEKPAAFNVADREYFAILKHGHQGLYVTKPLISRISGRPILLFARSYRHPDGRFAGIVAIPASLMYFQKVVSGYDLDENSQLSLRSDDFSLIVRHPEGIHGETLEPGSRPILSQEFQDAIARNPDRGTYHAASPMDGLRRVSSYDRLPLAPIYAICGITEEEFLADWVNLRRVTLSTLGIFLLLTHAVAWTLYRFWQKQRQDAVGLQESNARLQDALQEVCDLDNSLLAAREVGGLGTYSLDFVTDVWTRSPEQETIFGIDADYPHTGAAWRRLMHQDDLPLLLKYTDECRQTGNQTFDFEYRIVRPLDGAVRWIHGVGKLESDNGVPVRLLGAVKDVTEQKESRKRIEYLAYHDNLTGLPNRALLADRLHQALARARRHGELLAVCYLDLDGFKPVNDVWGHDVGDALLIKAAQRLLTCTRDGDTVARLGGDEFVVLLCGIRDEAELENIAQRLLTAIGKPYPVGEKTATLTMSMGMTVYPHDDVEEADVLIRHADQAMYEAKRNGRNRIHRFDSEGDRLRQEYQTRYARIVAALKDDEFRLHYQPKVDLRSGAVIGVEALLRWQHPENGLLLPGSFLPGVEDTDFTRPLGDWVLREALRQKRVWKAQGLDITVCVNVFGHHLQQADFIERFTEILAEFPDVPANGLDLEILETTAMHDLEAVSRRIQECARLGVDFALDDFGTGYSSLTYFRHLPVTFLKIDRSFVADILDNAEDQALVESLIGMAHALNRKVIAEGVETVEHGIPLLRYGCDYAQGFGIARPMPADEVIPWIDAWRLPESWKAAIDSGPFKTK